MRAGETIRRAVSREIVDPDGETVELDPAPGLAVAEIEDFVRRVGAPVPEALRLVLAETEAFGGVIEVTFTGAPGGVDLDGLVPRPLEIATDGFGNFWVLDLDDGTVWFHGHDPPTLVFQAPDLDTFVEQVIEANESEDGTAISQASEVGSMRLWEQRSTQGADTLREDDRFAFSGVEPELPETYRVVDLTSPTIGNGLVWADGAGMSVRRHPDRAAYVVVPAPQDRTEGNPDRRRPRFLRRRER